MQLLLLLCGDIETCPGAVQNYVELQELLKVKGFSLLHQNIRGLMGKKDLASDLLFTHNNINILSLSETLLTSESDNVEIGGYTFECKNRDKELGGGVGTYKDGTLYTRREDLECDELEMLWNRNCVQKCQNISCCSALSTPGFIEAFM